MNLKVVQQRSLLDPCSVKQYHRAFLYINPLESLVSPYARLELREIGAHSCTTCSETAAKTDGLEGQEIEVSRIQRDKRHPHEVI
jgi:hypothetical protein